MQYSKFYPVFQEEARLRGYPAVFEDEGFAALVDKTRVESGLKNNDTLYQYLDKNGRILFECLTSSVEASNKTLKIPRFGSIETVNRRKEYLKTYQKQRIRQVHLALGVDSDADIIAILEKQPNKQAYIKQLIREANRIPPSQ